MAETSATEWSPTWSVGERIRKAREDRGWLQSDLAIRLHVSRSAIGSWESNENRPNWATFKLLADATELPQWWLEGHDIEPPSGGVSELSDRRSRNRPSRPEGAGEQVAGSSGWTVLPLFARPRRFLPLAS